MGLSIMVENVFRSLKKGVQCDDDSATYKICLVFVFTIETELNIPRTIRPHLFDSLVKEPTNYIIVFWCLVIPKELVSLL